MRYNDLPKWFYAGEEKRYGGHIVRQELGCKKSEGAIIHWGTEESARLAAIAPDALRLLINLCKTDAAKFDPVKFQRDARVLLNRVGIDLSEPASESELLAFNWKEGLQE